MSSFDTKIPSSHPTSIRANTDNGDSSLAWLEAGKLALRCESESLARAADRLDNNFLQAVKLILDCRGKVVVSGLGKSGLVARKIAATFCSTGTPSVFLHPSDALHGDLGVYAPRDATVLISNSGSTGELLCVLPILRDLKSPIIGIIGRLASPLTSQVDIALDASVPREADPLNLAPTSSATVAMALGDALASALIIARRFGPNDFARFHPAGQLGRYLLLHVRDVMHKGDAVARVRLESSLKQVVIELTNRPLGGACVIDNNERLVGLITDGDVRRALEKYDDIRELCAQDIMSRTPLTVDSETSLRDALRLMEDRPSQISVLPVVEAPSRLIGLLRIHDIYAYFDQKRRSPVPSKD